MAWTTVICNECGEEYDVQMYGKMRDREWRVKNWSGYCDNCKQKFKEIKQKEIADENKKNADMAKAEGLPKLEGTEKQIAWAETLRKNRIEYIKVLIGSALQNNNINYAEWLKSKIESSKKETKASFFIDRRNSSDVDFEHGYDKHVKKLEAEKFLSN